jgi:hypothetical protein
MPVDVSLITEHARHDNDNRESNKQQQQKPSEDLLSEPVQMP